MTDPEALALAEAALAVEAERSDTLRRARAALLRGDKQTALQLLRQLCGLEEEDAADEGHRDRPGEHGRPGH